MRATFAFIDIKCRFQGLLDIYNYLGLLNVHFGKNYIRIL